MKDSKIYFMKNIEEVTLQGDLFIMSFDGEERSYYGWNKVSESGGGYKNLLTLVDNKNVFHEKNPTSVDNSVKQLILEMPLEQIEFIQALKQNKIIANSKNITVDISCMKIPNLFLMMKYLKIIHSNITLTIINTIPYDYVFGNEAFVSYRSFVGDLFLQEIIGFGGLNEVPQEEDLYVFLGFEGALSLKVVEETVYRNLYFVNTLPSYYQKYKDISLINNYNLLTLRNNSSVSFAPAINPFEVYNILCNKINDKQPVCIAPLCTKPIALGICMYALEHDNVKILYPISSIYNDNKSESVYKSYVYKVEI